MKYVLMYLAAILAANLLVTRFGPAVTVINAFLFIGLDLTTRDRLHDTWNGRYLWLRMATLIAVGAALSYLINRDAGRIAMASLVAFAMAGATDTVMYHLLRHRPRWQRINGSNIPAALVDSVMFPTLAFGEFIPLVVAGQFAAKVAGGWLWSAILTRKPPSLSLDNPS